MVLWGFIGEKGGEREEIAGNESLLLQNIKKTKKKTHRLLFSAFLLPTCHPPTEAKAKQTNKKIRQAIKEERENRLSYFLWFCGFSVLIKPGMAVPQTTA